MAEGERREGEGKQSGTRQMKSYTYPDGHASIHMINVHSIHMVNVHNTWWQLCTVTTVLIRAGAPPLCATLLPVMSLLQGWCLGDNEPDYIRAGVCNGRSPLSSLVWLTLWCVRCCSVFSLVCSSGESLGRAFLTAELHTGFFLGLRRVLDFCLIP